MYIETLRNKLKQSCKEKVMVHDAGLGRFYIYLVNANDIFTARNCVLEVNEVCGKKAKYNGDTERTNGRLYRYCIHGWDANQKSS